jgi:hypothetical protein
MSVDGTLGLGDLLVDPAQCSPRSVVAVLVVHDPIRDSAGLLTTAGRPRLGQHQLIGNSLVGVFVAPFPDHVGQKRDPGAQDERQPRSLQRVGAREEMIGNGSDADCVVTPRSSSAWPAANRWAAAAFKAARAASSAAEPMCSIERDPRRDDHTTCTAVAQNWSSPCAHTPRRHLTAPG